MLLTGGGATGYAAAGCNGCPISIAEESNCRPLLAKSVDGAMRHTASDRYAPSILISRGH